MNAPFNPRAGLRDPFSAFLSDLDTEDVAREVASVMGWPHERIHSGGIRYAAQALAVAASPRVLLVDLSDSTDPMAEIDGLAEVCEPGTIVIACGKTNDIGFYRKLMAHGLHDYLTKPFTVEHLCDVIEQAEAAANGARGGDTPASTHMLAAVVGARGGVGASTLAVSLAWLCAERQRKTALLDLDVHFGSGALAFDLEPGRGLIDAIENPSRIDGLFIERALVNAGERLGVLSAEAPISQPLPSDGGAFFQLQDELKATFACTVLDLPRHMLVQHPMLATNASVVVLVAELTLAGARDTLRILSWLKANAPDARRIVVINRAPPAGQEEVSRRDFEGTIEHKIAFMLPLDAKLAAQAARLGKPLAEVAKAAKWGPMLAALAGVVLGDEGVAKRKPGGSLLDRLSDVRGLLPRKKAA